VVLLLPQADFTAAAAALPLTLYNCGDSVEILTCGVTDTLRQLLDAGVSLDRLRVRSRTLDDLFLELTGKELRP
jgi:ABC-2 type transport system ATP-binding protein